jgi:2-polyprenyl-6-methoxyphenol hydroxylase-like FAD-dependent oxidoreductase
VKVHTLMGYGLLDKITRGRAVLIGDAAHPILPTHAQGGGYSLEDAAALEVLFQGNIHPQEVPERLQLFQNVRLSRCSVMQIMSNILSGRPRRLWRMLGSTMVSPCHLSIPPCSQKHTGNFFGHTTSLKSLKRPCGDLVDRKSSERS